MKRWFGWLDRGMLCAILLGMVGAVVLLYAVERQCRYEEVCE